MTKLTLVLGSALLAFNLTAFAEEQAEMGTEAEAQAMSEAAAALVNEQGEAAFEVFAREDGDFQQKDLYVFCMDMDGKMLSHAKKPELVGENMKDFDEYGDKLFENMIDTAASEEGMGWVEYQWPYPGTEALKLKKSYVIKNDQGFFCGVGAYAADEAADEAAPADTMDEETPDGDEAPAEGEETPAS
ncbi:MAG: cache domain-containing protein [Thiothrix sp.]|nr:cache domain-containing protein [Thiothrix sp.]HPE60313.1 cache domain-containing protein [Thiolinea sp.]